MNNILELSEDRKTVIGVKRGYDYYIITPNGTTKIGDNAFSCCSSLQSIDIPNSVTTIGDFAFSGCSELKSIDIPNSVTIP